MDLNQQLAEVARRYRKASEAEIKAAMAVIEARDNPYDGGDFAAVLVTQAVISAKMASRLRLLAARDQGPNIPGYEILMPLGGGGMGIVYKARQLGLDRLVALKVLAPEYLKHQEYLARFAREARAAGRLDHPNIVRAFDVSAGDPEHGLSPYLAMEYIRGQTLHEVLKRKPQLSERQALRIGRAIADALDHAFRVGLVHRDIKPDNIMVTTDGHIKLCDLGLAKSVFQDQEITRQGMTHGTPHFMSPEQAQGAKLIDIRSDLYSLGATLYRLVIGEPPFLGQSAVAILTQHLESPPPSPKAKRQELSLGFDRVVLRLLEKAPEARYQYPAHLRQDFELLLRGKDPKLDYGIPFRPPMVPPEYRDAASASARRRASAMSADPQARTAQVQSFDAAVAVPSDAPGLAPQRPALWDRPLPRPVQLLWHPAGIAALVVLAALVFWLASGTATPPEVAPPPPAVNANQPAAPTPPKGDQPTPVDTRPWQQRRADARWAGRREAADPGEATLAQDQLLDRATELADGD